MSVAWTSSRIHGMNSSRTRFGRISIKALNCPYGEKMECEHRAPVHSGECLMRWSESKKLSRRRQVNGEVRERVFEFIPRMEVEDLGAKRHSRATLDWFWRSRAAFLEVGSGHFRFYVTPLSLFLSCSSRVESMQLARTTGRRYIALRWSSSAAD